MAELLFLDTETLGIEPTVPIWELAAVRVDDTTGQELDRCHFQVQHDPANWLDTLPQQFIDDYEARYNESTALTVDEAIAELNRVSGWHTPILIGGNVVFDAVLIKRTWMEPRGVNPPWHYHVEDISSMARGYLAAKGGMPETKNSRNYSLALGIDPDDYARHTAMGDVEWFIYQWKTMMGLA